MVGVMPSQQKIAEQCHNLSQGWLTSKFLRNSYIPSQVFRDQADTASSCNLPNKPYQDWPGSTWPLQQTHPLVWYGKPIREWDIGNYIQLWGCQLVLPEQSKQRKWTWHIAPLLVLTTFFILDKNGKASQLHKSFLICKNTRKITHIKQTIKCSRHQFHTSILTFGVWHQFGPEATWIPRLVSLLSFLQDC